MNNLTEIFYNPKHSAGFSSSSKLIKALKGKVPPKKVKEWLQSQDAYTLHKPIRKNFQRNKYSVSNKDDLWESDLVDMRSLNKYNNGINYILTVIDVFSKFAWAVPLKTKKGSCVARAFEKIFKISKRHPLLLRTDKGKEFTAQAVQTVLKTQGVKYNVTNNPDIKAAVVERFNRTLKMKMWKYFTYKNTKRYINILQHLLSAYNSTKHSTTKFAPNEVNDDNILRVWKNLHKPLKAITTDAKYASGDCVRITKEKHIFKKGYESNWSDEIFKIKSVVLRNPVVYKLHDLNDVAIEGTFYEQELQKVIISTSTLFKIDKILKSRGIRRRREYYVKWYGYPESFNCWVKASDLREV